MAIVKAGKFMMRMVTFMMMTSENILGKPLDWDVARKRVFRGISGVEGLPEDFRKINEQLERFPVYKQFEIEEDSIYKIMGVKQRKR